MGVGVDIFLWFRRNDGELNVQRERQVIDSLYWAVERGREEGGEGGGEREREREGEGERERGRKEGGGREGRSVGVF